MRTTVCIFVAPFLLFACSSDAEPENAAATRAVVTTVADQAVVDEASEPAATSETTSSSAPVEPEVSASSTSTADIAPSAGGIPDFTIGVDETVRFEAGGTSAVLTNAVVRGERNRYTLEAAAGQTMNLTITSLEDNAVFDVYGPNEVELAGEATSVSISLPSDGMYTIIVGGTRGNASYDLTVEIPAG